MYMFIMVLWKNNAYSSKLESTQRNQELQVGHASNVARGHRASGDSQRQGASVKACKHRTWHVRIWQTTSANDMRISQGLHKSAMA